MRKRGQIPLYEFLIGIVIGVITLLFLYSLVTKILISGEDWEGSYHELVSKVQEVSLDNKHASKNYLLKLEEDTAIIALNPKQAAPLGRFGDGDFHYVTNDEAWNYLKDRISATNGKLAMSNHFPRPLACPNDEACICLCKKPRTEPVDEDYLRSKQLTPEMKDIYVRQGYYKRLGILQKFGVDIADFDLSFTITCNELQCESLKNTQFYTPMKNNYYQTYFIDYTQSEIDTLGKGGKESDDVARLAKLHEETGIPAGEDLGIYKNIARDDKAYPIPDYLYENGFALYRYKDEFLGVHLFGQATKLPASIPLRIEKVSNGDIAVCIDNDCGTSIDIDLAIANAQSGQVITPTVTQPQEEEEPAEDEECTYPYGSIGTGTTQLFNDLVTELKTPQESRNIFYINTIDDPLSTTKGLAADHYLKLQATDKNLLVQVLYSCGSTYTVLAEETITQTSLSYDDRCGTIDFFSSPGDSIILHSPMPTVIVCAEELNQ